VAVTAFVLYGILRRQMRWLEREVDGREQAEQLMRESQARFATIFRSIPMGITLSRLDNGRIVDANPAVLSLLGYSREEIMGRSSGEIGLFASPEDRNRLVEILRTQGRVEDIELRFRKKSGEIGTMLGSAELIQLAGKAHLLCMMLDITDRKRAEEARKASEELYHAVFEHSLAALAIIEEDGTVSLANTQLSKALGYSREEIEGKMDWTGLLVPEDLERLEACHRARMMDPDGAPVQYECRVRRKDGIVIHGIIRVGMIPGTKRTIFSGMEVAGPAAGTSLHSTRPHSSDRPVSLSGRLGEKGSVKSLDVSVRIPDPHESNGISS
jgi:PAS domain S-box-containing protein